MTNRFLCAAAAVLAGAISFQCVWAQAYPDRPVTVISASAVGGPMDTVFRPVIAALGNRLGVPVIIENRGGANGAIATRDVAKAPADGYTLLATYLAPVAINPAMRSGLEYDSVKDFAPITQLTSAPLVILARPELPIKTLRELVAYAKAHPGELSYGTVGAGSAGHLLGAMLAAESGAPPLTHVPYKGAGPVITDLQGGHIDLGFISLAGGLPLIKSGRMTAIAVSTKERSQLAASVPAIAETYPGIDVNSWYGVMAPAGTPAPIVVRLQSELSAVLKEPEIVTILAANGLESKGSMPEEFAQTIRNEIPRWAAAVKAAGLDGQR